MSVFSKPHIVGVEVPYAPFTLSRGVTIVRVVCEGRGTLTIGSNVRRKFTDGLDELFLVDTAPTITVVVRSWLGSERKQIALAPIAAPEPISITGRVQLPAIKLPSMQVALDALQPPGT